MRDLSSGELAGFERFLNGAGLHLQRRFADAGNFGNVLVVYANAVIRVRMVCDRSAWTISVSGAYADEREGEWDIGLFQELLQGIKSDNLSVRAQVAFLEQHLPEIVDCFGADKVRDMTGRLNRLGEERARRLLPEAFTSRWQE